MKALVYTGIGQLEMQEVAQPEGDFLIKVAACGVCGTDLKTYLKGHHFFKPPTILGHEFYGHVAKVPKDSRYHVGDAVVVAPYYECGECSHCARDLGQLCPSKKYVPSGSFCEYISLPKGYEEKGVFAIPTKASKNNSENLADEIVFTLVEPLACVLNGNEHLSLRKQSRVLVVGSGPMGTLFALYYQQKGIPVAMVEPNSERREAVIRWGIEAYGPGEADISAFDNIVIAVNKAELVAEYITKAADGATVLVFGGLKKEESLIVDSYAVHYREVTVTGSFGYSLRQFKAAFSLICENPTHYQRLITHRFPLELGRNAFELLKLGKAFKVALIP